MAFKDLIYIFMIAILATALVFVRCNKPIVPSGSSSTTTIYDTIFVRDTVTKIKKETAFKKIYTRDTVKIFDTVEIVKIDSLVEYSTSARFALTKKDSATVFVSATSTCLPSPVPRDLTWSIKLLAPDVQTTHSVRKNTIGAEINPATTSTK